MGQHTWPWPAQSQTDQIKRERPRGHSSSLVVSAMVKGHKGTGAGFRTGVSRQEARLLRTGILNRREREIVLLKARRQSTTDGTAVMRPSTADPASLVAPPAAPPTAPLAAPPAKEGAYATRLADAEARGLDGGGVDEEQRLRRLIRARAADAAQEAKQSTVTPAAALLLAQMRTQVAREAESAKK